MRVQERPLHEAGWRLCLASALILLASCGGGGSSGSDGDGTPAIDYLPLAVGNRWSYLNSPDQSQTIVRVTGGAVMAGRPGNTLDVFNEANVRFGTLFYVASSNGIEDIPAADATAFRKALGPIQLLRVPSTPGDTFVQVDKTFDNGVDFDGDGRSDRVSVRAVVTVVGIETITTPAGTFTDVLHQRTETVEIVTYSAGGRSEPVNFTSDDWYAPGVGPVRNVTTTRFSGFSDTTTQTLTAYRVGVVRSESVAPTVLSVSPATSPVRGSNLAVAATFSEPMDVQTFATGAFAVFDADNHAVAGTVALQRSTATFVPAQPWATGTYTARIGPPAQDFVGNALAGEQRWSFTVDSTAPGVISSVPAAGADSASVAAPIVLQFNEPIAPATVNASTVFLTSNGGSVPTTLSVSGSTLTITPTTALERGKAVHLSIGPGVSDTLGNPMDVVFTLDFRTDQGRFAYPVALAPNLSGDAMAIGDVNGDGINDVVFASTTAADTADSFALFVMYGRSDGTLAPATRAVAGSDGACSASTVAVGDVDGDGRNDVVCGPQIFHQTVDGRLVLAQSLTLAATSIMRIVDLDGDGRLDMVGASGGVGSINIWRQNAGGQQVLQATPGLGAAGAWDFQAGDVNGDGRPDLVFALNGGATGNDVAVMLQQADGSFAAPIYLSVGGGWGARGVAIGDLNGDGRNDIVVTTGGNTPTSIGVFYQQPGGSLAPVKSISTYEIPMAVRVADVDGDGRLDVVVSHQGWMTVGVYRQQADGTLAAEELYQAPYGTFNPNSMAVGDVNRDGRADIVIAGELLLQKATPMTPAGRGVATMQQMAARAGQAGRSASSR